MKPGSPACRHQLKDFEVELSNNGNVKFAKNSIITYSLVVNAASPINEVYTLPNDIVPGADISYTFPDISNQFIDGINSVIVYFTVKDDINRKNDTLKYNLLVGADPVLNLAGGIDTVRFTPPYTLDAGGSFKSYLWSNSAIERSIIVTQPGWYTLIVTNNVGCKATDSVYLTDGTSINNVNLEDQMSVFPNPATTIINIKIENTYLERPILEVFTVDSKIEYSIKLNENITNVNQTIDVGNWMRGFYYIRVYDKAKPVSYFKKFVLQ